MKELIEKLDELFAEELDNMKGLTKSQIADIKIAHTKVKEKLWLESLDNYVGK